MAVTITCGVNTVPSQKAVGMTVREVANLFRDQLAIPNDAKVLVNGRNANMDVTLSDGSTLEFVKHQGEKGLFLAA